MPTSQIHGAYASLLQECPSLTIVWLEGSRLYTAKDMLQAVEAGDPVAARYAGALLKTTLALLHSHLDNWEAPADLLKLDVSPREHFISVLRQMPVNHTVWKTVGQAFKAPELAELMEDRAPLGLQYATEALRTSRGLQGRKSAILAEKGAFA